MGMVKLWLLIESKPLNRLWYNFPQLITSTRRTRNPKFVPIDPKGASGQIREYKALSFFILINFFPRTRLLKRSVDGFSRRVAQITRNHARKCLFWGLHDGRKHLGGQIPPKPSKLGVNMLCERLSCASMKFDVIEHWRHWRVTE